MTWKMENDQIVLEDGNPVWIAEDNKEIAFDFNQTSKRIAELNEEAKNHRLKAKEYADKLATYTDAGIDIEKAKKAIETVQNLDDKKLVDAKQVDVLKSQWAADMEKTRQQWAEKEKRLSEALEKEMRDRQEQIKRQHFSDSAQNGYLKNTVLTPDVAYKIWGDKFKVENDNIIPMLNETTPLPSSDPLKPHANFNEALERMFENYEYKNNYLKSPAPGSGSSGNAAGGKSAITLSRADALDPMKYRAAKEQAEKTGQSVKIV